jgi:hypothetical protein
MFLYINSGIIYKSEGSSNYNINEDPGTSGEDPSTGDKGDDSDDKDDETEEEESFEIEEEIENIEKLMKISNNAMILDEKLPYSQKNNNRYLNDLRKNPQVKEFFEGKTPSIADLPELN